MKSPLSLDPGAAATSDAALVSRIAGGDKAAFEPLMRRYNRLLFRTARSILKDDAEAEDVLQNAYLKAFCSMSAFRGESGVSTWLTRIVMNEALARVRTTQRRAEIIHLEFHMDEDQINSQADSGAQRSEAPEAAAIRAQTRRLLERKIDELPEAFRTVFMLREVEEMGVEQVGQVLDIPEATVRTRHFRARGMLRDSLSREVDFALGDAFGFDGDRCNRIVDIVLSKLPIPGPDGL